MSLAARVYPYVVTDERGFSFTLNAPTVGLARKAASSLSFLGKIVSVRGAGRRVGKNSLCQCGSGKLAKRCCLRKDKS